MVGDAELQEKFPIFWDSVGPTPSLTHLNLVVSELRRNMDFATLSLWDFLKHSSSKKENVPYNV